MLDHRLRRLVIVGVALGLSFVAAGQEARAREKRQDQSFTGSGVRLDDFNVDLTVSFKGRPGKATGTAFVRLDAAAPATERCQGFPLEAPVLGGSVVEIFRDFSKVIGDLESGYVCLRLDGFVDGRIEGTWVGGVKRYEAASGTFTLQFQGVSIDNDIAPPKGMSASGSITGTIVVDR